MSTTASVSAAHPDSSIKAVHNPTTSIPPTVMPLVSPTALLHAYLQQNPPTRPSNRGPDQAQHVDLNTGSLTHTNGSAVAKIGATTIVCGVRAEILPVSEIPTYDARTTSTTTDSSEEEEDDDDDDDDDKAWRPETHTPITLYNLLVPNLELATGCSPLHPANNAAPSAQAQSLSQRLYTLLLTSGMVRASDLQIVHRPTRPSPDDGQPGDRQDIDPDDPAYIDRYRPEVKAFWVLYIDMVCLSYGGAASVFDAAWLSLSAALRDTVLPQARWDVDEGRVQCSPDRALARRLRIRTCPVPLSFAVFAAPTSRSPSPPTPTVEAGVEMRNTHHWILIDPDAFEEQSCPEAGCVVVDFSSDATAGRRRYSHRSSGDATTTVSSTTTTTTTTKGTRTPRSLRVVRLEKSGGNGLLGSRELRSILRHAEARWNQWTTMLLRSSSTTSALRSSS